MKVYNKEGKSMNADKDQMPILIDAGWSTTKPEPVVESVDVSEPVVVESVDVSEEEPEDELDPAPSTIKAVPRTKKAKLVKKILPKA